ncbi:hypothetical protein F2Q69_00044398 [Brassica cretica]|uniref:Uncharacterized protein n=1 Tax=Brassica cretica TaxID=69181 RepID=A0A8S9NE59_BRACR|nr:hypothetical protein F2Q69_00044398 [Brassica cretica]
MEPPWVIGKTLIPNKIALFSQFGGFCKARIDRCLLEKLFENPKLFPKPSPPPPSASFPFGIAASREQL